MRNATILLAATLAAGLHAPAALAGGAGDTARNLLPMGGDTGHSAVDVRQGLVGGPIAVPNSPRPTAADTWFGLDPKTTGSVRPLHRPAQGRSRWDR